MVVRGGSVVFQAVGTASPVASSSYPMSDAVATESSQRPVMFFPLWRHGYALDGLQGELANIDGTIALVMRGPVVVEEDA
jgi:hypothetical protein